MKMERCHSCNTEEPISEFQRFKSDPLHDLKLAIEVDNLFGKPCGAFKYVSPRASTARAHTQTRPPWVGAHCVPYRRRRERSTSQSARPSEAASRRRSP